MTRRDWIRAAERRLAEAGFDAARMESQLLAAAAIGVERSHLLPQMDAPWSDTSSADELLERRLAGEPLAYLLGVREFFGRPFLVGPGVLVPRHETETVVEVLLRAVPEGARVLDIGTGSGCIAATLALERGDLTVVGIDVSTDALAYALANRDALGASVGLVAGDLATPFRARSFQAIATNPPYVALDDPLPRDVAEWEPAGALWAGEDGLAVYRRLSVEAGRVLEPGGVLVAEIGHGQGDAVAGLFGAAGWEVLDTVADLSGVPRAATLRVP